MRNKAQELELRTIMQGLEEFATFMSYRGNSQGLRIISVETVQQYHASQQQSEKPTLKAKADVVPITKPSQEQSLRRSLSFNDRITH
jgi:hypothetical protein